MIRRNSAILVLSFLGAFTGMFVFYQYFNPVKKIYVEQQATARQAAENDFLFSDRMQKLLGTSSPTDFVEAAKSSRESVVFIRSLKSIRDANYNNSYGAASGSGVIISSDGYIVTNNHVIANGTDVEVQLNNNKEYQAKIIGTDESTDLALIKIEADNLPFLIFGDSDALAVGEWVMAVGNPFRLQSTVTAGIVSAKARNINILENYGVESFIQTDAAVNPGNSGGALVNTRGELIGINAAIMTQSGNYEGFSFAIPSNLARKVVKDLMEFGTVQRGWLGVEIRNLNNQKAQELGLENVSGVYLAVVRKGSGAEEAGLESGDVMIEVNGAKTNNTPVFMEQIARYRPGDKVVITYIRNGQTFSAEVILRNQLNTTDYIAIRKDRLLQELGIEVRELDSEERRKYNYGIYVVSVEQGSMIGSTNLEPGYYLQTVNEIPVRSVDDFLDFLSKSSGTVIVKGFYANYPGEYPYSFQVK